MCINMGDYESLSFYNEEIRKARKTHTCTECRRVIKPKEFYQYVSGKWEGIISTHHTCSHCLVVQKWLQKECGGFLFEGLLEDIQEHFYEGYYRVGKLTVGMRRKWKKFNSEELMKIPALPAVSE